MEEDERFAHIVNDPKFRRIPKGERKVKIDKRFKCMFEDKNFKVKYTTDKRGRPINHTSNEDLKRYYELNSGESSESENDDSDTPGKYVRAPEYFEDNDLAMRHKSDAEISNKIKKKLQNLKVDYARGESKLCSESSSDDDSYEDNTSDEEIVEHAWGELDHDAERTEEVTHRLAACNMDWDRIRAVDLMVLFNSFLPTRGSIKSVTIYPSEFGLQRMKEEEVKGPTELVESKSIDDDTGEESMYHMEKLRQYQLNRLKYYYAVIDCDHEKTANKIYIECDGLEYESSATKMDLRFIPNHTTFDQDPKEVCVKLPELGKYQPRFFTTTALQQVKVDLTWDETNPERIEITNKLALGKIDEIADTDLQTYLASSSGSEEEIENTQEHDNSENDEKKDSLNKYKALLQEIESKEKSKDKKDIEMEISWGIDLKDNTQKLVNKKLNDKVAKTPFQQYLEKRKEKQKVKREERKQKHKQDPANSSEDSDIPSDIDMNDPYFAEEFEKPAFKKQNNLTKIIHSDSEELKKKAELELLLLNTEDEKKHFSLQKIQDNEKEKKLKNKSKSKKKEIVVEKEDNFQINLADERFSALYFSHHFNIDPTDSHYKKTKGVEAIVCEKLKRRNTTFNDVQKKPKTGIQKDNELSVLVKSVKRKTEALNKKKQ